MKRLNVSTLGTPVAQRVMETLFFEHIQAKFNLHPWRILEDFRGHFGKFTFTGALPDLKDTATLADELHALANHIFKHSFRIVLEVLKGKMRAVKLPDEMRRIDYPEYGLFLRDYLNLDALGMINLFQDRAEIGGVRRNGTQTNLSTLDVALLYQANIPIVIDWAFEKIKQNVREKQEK